MSIGGAALGFITCLPATGAENPGARTTVTRQPIQQERLAPVAMTQLDQGHYFIDFGKASFGGLVLEIDNPDDGRQLVVHMGETISGPSTVHRTPGGSIRYWTATLTLQAGKKNYVVPLRKQDHRLMSEAIGPVMPFRYVELENAPSMIADNVRQTAAHYAFNDDDASFKCSDPKLNAIWEMCRHTIKATSFGGVFIDGDRERLPYEADAYINQLGWYACTNDLTLPRYSHEYLILKPTWPTEWILLSVFMAREDFRYTGDPASLREFYQELKAKTLIALARKDGLISTVQPPFPPEVGTSIHIKKIRDIVDWPAGERDGFQMMPVNTVVNAFHCRALQIMAELAGALNHHDDQQFFRNAAARSLQSINTKLIDQATGLYIDGEGSSHSSQHANLFPLAFGLVPTERRASVAAFVRSRGMACSVYGAQFLMDALFDNNMADDAIALMTADNDRSWSHMIERLGTTMALEAWDKKYKANLDWNHAWGAAPANILPRKVIGVEPMEPGFSKIMIRPHIGKLVWAEGKVPTTRGPVRVKIEQAPNQFQITVEIPPHTTAKIGMPAVRNGTVSLDGTAVTAEQSDHTLFVDKVSPGKHLLVLRW